METDYLNPAMGETGSASEKAQKILEEGTEAYEKAEQTARDIYNKTSQKVSETYEKAKNYGYENPGTTILIALGIGVGLGLLIGTGSHGTRTNRIAKPVVRALSDIASEFFR